MVEGWRPATDPAADCCAVAPTGAPQHDAADVAASHARASAAAPEISVEFRGVAATAAARE